MSIEQFTEDSYEQTLISLFKELGYQYECGYNVERDYRLPYHADDLRAGLQRLNPSCSDYVIEEAYRLVTNINEGTLEQRNEQLMDYLQSGVEVKYSEDGRSKTALVRLIDFENPQKNNFVVRNQWRVVEYESIRCDIVVFINGLPLVVIELKSPSREETDEEDAYTQIKQYQQKCPSLFVYNAFNVTSDMFISQAGTITAKRNRYMEWKSVDGKSETTEFADYETFFNGIFQKERLIDILQNFECFDHKDGRMAKIMAAYHQYFAVNKALRHTHTAMGGDGKIGVFWHTQGSGKSLSMVFYVHRLIQEFPQCTIVVVTDRNDLDQQLYEQFAGCQKFLRQEPQRVGFEISEKGKVTKTAGREDLVKKLKDLQTGGIIFTTIQKFEEGTGLLSERENIIVITDEAHRSQYGEEHWDVKAEKMKKGFALLMHEALPHASFIGFTGTPISERDRDTKEVFGDYIDVYDMTQAVADGATRPVYYESRVINLNLNEEALRKLDEEFDRLAEEGATEEQISKVRHDNSGLKEILCHQSTIESLCDDILKHYEENRQHELTGKAMIVAYNKEAAVKIYKRILELRPEWTEKVHVVASAANTDNPEWHDIINARNNKEYAKLFKDDDSPMKIAIVVDMWLTGFDVPSLATMYVYKPMKGHNLMQAIARVNRVFPDKEGGLIVDYVGIAQALRQAMNDYTSRDKKQFGDPDIQKTAKVKFQEKLEICRDLLYGFDYTGFYDGSDPERARIIKGGLNFLLAPDKADKQKDYIKESQLLHNALTLCRSLITPREKQEETLMNAVRVLLQRFTQNHGPVTKQEINERIATLIEQSIQSTGVINLFETKREFSLFDEGFIEELRKMKEKNLAVQLLEKLLKEHIRKYERTNLVQSQKFSDLMNQALSNYLKGMLTNEEVIEELLKMAEEIKKTEEEGNKLGLNIEEKAFYDALTSPEGIRDAYSNDEFIALTKELTEQLRQNRTIDWNKKESARAKMRVLVKRLLKKYKYPPEGQEQALATVMAQCNKWADDEDNLVVQPQKTLSKRKAIEMKLIPDGSVLENIEPDTDEHRLIHNMMALEEGTTIMNIVVECQKEFQEKYFSMQTKDWYHLVRDYVRKVTERPELQETEVFRYVMAG
ncbi:type I restriction endonuclease subunit R [Prevotella sp. E13-27]|nr:type I restriction endonuclease subunit R [Prevotella sp. E13-27]MCK8623543.1 type I restriction endonuclease subunit R [Prevotella sp. E13-27]